MSRTIVTSDAATFCRAALEAGAVDAHVESTVSRSTTVAVLTTERICSADDVQGQPERLGVHAAGVPWASIGW